MAILEIFDVNQPCLRAKCQKVTRITPSEKKLLDDMIETMRAANGIGLAAPQVGVTRRLLVVEVEEDLFALINPEILDLSHETEIMEEGCLSLPNYYGPVERSVRTTVRAQDRTGKKIRIKAEGLLARVLQHEIDHLDGVLFFDPSRMRSLDDLHYSPPKQEGTEADETDGEGADKQEAEAAAVPSGSNGHAAISLDERNAGSHPLHAEIHSLSEIQLTAEPFAEPVAGTL